MIDTWLATVKIQQVVSLTSNADWSLLEICKLSVFWTHVFDRWLIRIGTWDDVIVHFKILLDSSTLYSCDTNIDF